MTSTEMEQGDSGQQSVIKAVFLFFAAFALYFFTHSPALDEIDAVQFAMGVRSFDLWHHQPHPPGYPLFIFLGWLGTKLFHTGTESSLYRYLAFRPHCDHTTGRSAQWYAPQFKILDRLPISEEDEEVLRNAAAIYTEDPSLKQKDCYLIELAEFRRSMLIFPQHRRVRLYLVERRRSS